MCADLRNSVNQRSRDPDSWERLTCGVVVRAGRLELPPLPRPGPKPGASANSATLAYASSSRALRSARRETNGQHRGDVLSSRCRLPVGEFVVMPAHARSQHVDPAVRVDATGESAFVPGAG